MILSVSRRTDVPCYYSQWFVNRLKDGYVLTRNPFNNAQISKIHLTPDVIDCIVFWTKDAKNTIPYLKNIDKMGYSYYFQFTITPYDKDIERNLREKTDIENTFIELSKLIGKDRVLWRYDPIILNDNLTIDYHKNQFERMCEKLHSYTNSVTISFVDLYKKVKTDLIREISESEMIELAEFMGETARKYNMEIKTCSEKLDFSKYGIAKGSCIDKNTIEKICGANINLKPDKNQRDGCGCIESVDIGAYNSCLNGCVYCYANHNYSSTLARHKNHNPQNNILIGNVLPNEKISTKNYKSNIENQISF